MLLPQLPDQIPDLGDLQRVKDLIQAGMKPGKELGEVLKKFLEIVLEEPEKNTKEVLLQELDAVRTKN